MVPINKPQEPQSLEFKGCILGMKFYVHPLLQDRAGLICNFGETWFQTDYTELPEVNELLLKQRTINKGFNFFHHYAGGSVPMGFIKAEQLRSHPGIKEIK